MDQATENEPLRLLIVGVGSIGERHLRCFQSTGRCSLAICEINSELRESIATRYGVERTYPDLDTALGDYQFDAAVVATPAPLHIPMSMQLAQLGKHLLLEKPVSISLQGVDELCRTVADKQLVVSVGYVLRAHPLNSAVQQVLQEERFGRPLQAVFQTGQAFAKYRPAYRTIYYADRRQGGGAIQDAMTHFYNLGEWLLGPMDRVVTDAAHQALAGVSVEDTVHTLARHGDVLATYTLNQYQAPHEATYTIVCEGGTLRADWAKGRWSWMTEPDTPWVHESAALPERDTLYIAQAERFLDALAGQASPLCTLDEGVQTLRVNLASLRSSEEQNWQAV